MEMERSGNTWSLTFLPTGMCRIGKTSFCENWLSTPVCKLTAHAPHGGGWGVPAQCWELQQLPNREISFKWQKMGIYMASVHYQPLFPYPTAKWRWEHRWWDTSVKPNLGLNDLKCLFQPKWFSVVSSPVFRRSFYSSFPSLLTAFRLDGLVTVNPKLCMCMNVPLWTLNQHLCLTHWLNSSFLNVRIRNCVKSFRLFLLDTDA